MVPSFAPMFMLDLMDVQRALVLLLSNLLMTLATPFSSSMVMIGKAALLRSVKTVSQVLKDLVVLVEDLAVVEALVADLEVVEASGVAVADSAADLAEVVVDLVEVTPEAPVDSTVVLELPQLHPTLSPTMLPLELREVRLSMFAT